MGYGLGNWDMVDSINDRNLAAAGDDMTTAGLWDVHMRRRLAEYKRDCGSVYAVPPKELFKEWVKEAQALTLNGSSNGGSDNG